MPPSIETVQAAYAKRLHDFYYQQYLAFRGYTETGNGYANAGIDVSGKAAWLFLLLGLGYYVLCEAATGATLGKRIVGIHVIGEDGKHLTFGAAVVRNLLRLVDCLFFYLVGAIFALTSQQGQRLGDRAAHTLVVRR